MDDGSEDWLDPTPEMLNSPEFNAVWDLIKKWNIKIVGDNPDKDCLKPTGRHARAIIDAINNSRPKTLMSIVKTLQKDDIGGQARMSLINKMEEMLKNTIT